MAARQIRIDRDGVSHAGCLRRKLGAAGEHWIVNVHGVGYHLV